MSILVNKAKALMTLAIFASVIQGIAFASMPEATELGLSWRKPTIQIAVSSSMLRQNPNVKSDSDVGGAIKRSLRAWSEAANITLRDGVSDRQNVSAAGVAGDGLSLITIAATPENVLLFQKDPEQAAATTRIFYDRRGFITEADIVLNPYQQFSTDGTFGTYDLESTLTHEIGHLLGLDHSTIPGSTMYENYGKNGVFGVMNFGARTLAESDIAAVRGIYGLGEDVAECCGSITGRLSDAAGKPLKSVELWAEDTESGRVYASAVTGADGRFKFDGIKDGKYVVFSRQHRRGKTHFPSQEIEAVDLEAGRSVTITKRLAAATPDAELKYIGFNAQLSVLSVPVGAGRTITIFLGGEALDARTAEIGFSSGKLSIVPNSIARRDYGPDVSVVSFDLKADADIEPGEYTVFVRSANGARSAIPGGIVVSGGQNISVNTPIGSE